MKIVLDIEADNLYDLATKIHVVCVRDVDTDDAISFTNPATFKRYIWHRHPEQVIFHNGIGYDLPLMRRLWGIPYSVGKTDMFGERETEFVDTCQLSQFLWPDRPGGHSLDNLAKLAGSFKQEFKGPWDICTPEMIEYCLQDTKASVAVYKYLTKECGVKYADSKTTTSDSTV